jgi:hypothetical protein
VTKLFIYINREDAKKTEQEELQNFIHSVLSEINLPINNIWPEDGLLSVQQKIELKNLLAKVNINIINSDSDDTLIYVDKDLIATWKKPRYILRTDISEINPAKKVFLEMIIEYESVFEQKDPVES